MVLQPILAGFLKAYPHVQLELTNDEGRSSMRSLRTRASYPQELYKSLTGD